MEESMLTGNKGEWSEIYTFLKLLSDGGIYAADSELHKIENIYYPLIKILRNERGIDLEYHWNDSIKVIDAHTETLLLELTVHDFKEQSVFLLQKIQTATGSSFAVQEIEEFLKKLKINSIKAKSTDKSDIRIMVHDQKTGMNSILGFSIKSKLGGASTLLNAGRTTNFIYKIRGRKLSQAEIDTINCISSKAKIRDRLIALEESGCTLEYFDISSEMFKLNLQVIDSLLPKMLAQMLVYYYKGQATSMNDIVQKLNDDNPCNFNMNHNHRFYEYKIKNLLRDVALGMTPAKEWTGTFDASGGYIVVKEDGEIVCYHIYNHNEFQDYLLMNTKLETASSTRYEFGIIEVVGDEYFFNLNLQIRFK